MIESAKGEGTCYREMSFRGDAAPGCYIAELAAGIDAALTEGTNKKHSSKKEGWLTHSYG